MQQALFLLLDVNSRYIGDEVQADAQAPQLAQYEAADGFFQRILAAADAQMDDARPEHDCFGKGITVLAESNGHAQRPRWLHFQSFRQRTFYGKITVYPDGAAVQKSCRECLGFPHGRNDHVIPCRPFIDGKEMVDIGRRRNDRLAMKIAGQFARHLIGPAYVPRKEGNDVLPFFIDDQDSRIGRFALYIRSNTAHGNTGSPDKDQQFCPGKGLTGTAGQIRLDFFQLGIERYKFFPCQCPDLPATQFQIRLYGNTESGAAPGKGKQHCLHRFFTSYTNYWDALRNP